MSTVTPFLNLVKPAPLENFSRATYNTNLDLIDAHAITVEKFSKGIMSYETRSAASAGITVKGIVENIPTVTFKGGRMYRVVWNASATVSVADGYFTLGISTCLTTDGAALTTGLTDITTSSIAHENTGGERFYVEGIYEPPADITLQIKFWAERATGTGTWTMENKKAWFYIEDMGDQF